MMKFKKPDLNAPRFRKTWVNSLKNSELEVFKKKHTQYKDVPREKLRKILMTFNKSMYETAINYRDGVEFPEGLGFIFIGTCQPPKKFNTNYEKSKVLDLRARHRNFESDNYLAKIFYTNFANKYKFQFRDLWNFKGVRQFTREVARTYPEKWKLYLQVENFVYISKLFRKKNNRNFMSEFSKHLPPTYNEFALD